MTVFLHRQQGYPLWAFIYASLLPIISITHPTARWTRVRVFSWVLEIEFQTQAGKVGYKVSTDRVLSYMVIIAVLVTVLEVMFHVR